MNLLSRRRFCALTAATAAGAAIDAKRAWASVTGLPIGIQLYTVGKPYADDPAGTLKQLWAMGYREVETSIMPKLSAKDQRKMMDDAGLTCPSVHMDMNGANLDAGLADVHTLGAHYALSSVLRDILPELRKAEEEARKTGKAGMPALPPLGMDGFKKTAAHMNEVGRKVKAAGLQYAYHNHNFEFEKMPDGSVGYDILVKETDPDLVKFEVDCGWMTVAGSDPLAYFGKYPGRFRMLHIKDFQKGTQATTDLTGPGRPKGTDLGTGFIDYKQIFAAAKGAGVEHIFAEQEPPFAVSQMASAKADFAYMQKFS